jgi:ammonia channel protein AmtB
MSAGFAALAGAIVLGRRKSHEASDLIIPLRVSEKQEELGLDLSQHGEVMQEPAGVAPAFPLTKTA